MRTGSQRNSGSTTPSFKVRSADCHHKIDGGGLQLCGLGSFGAHGLAPEAIKEAIAEIRSLTSKPFAMNLWVSMEDEGARTSDENAFNGALRRLPPISPLWERLTQRSNRIRRLDLKIKLAFC